MENAHSHGTGSVLAGGDALQPHDSISYMMMPKKPSNSWCVGHLSGTVLKITSSENAAAVQDGTSSHLQRPDQYSLEPSIIWITSTKRTLECNKPLPPYWCMQPAISPCPHRNPYPHRKQIITHKPKHREWRTGIVPAPFLALKTFTKKKQWSLLPTPCALLLPLPGRFSILPAA